MGFMTVIVLALSAVALIFYWFKKSFSYWEKRGFVFVPPEIPFGSLKGVGYKVHFSEKTRQFYEEYKNKAKALGIYFFVSPAVLVTNLEVIKHILVKDFNSFHDRGVYFNAKDDPLSAHLFAIEGAEWKHIRSKLTPTFTSGKMKMMFGLIRDNCQDMINHLSEHEQSAEIEMKDILTCFTTDVIGNVAFGLEMNSLKDPDSMFRKMGKKNFDVRAGKTLKVIFVMNFKKLARRLGVKLIDEDVSDFFMSSIRETVEYREKHDVKRNDFLSLLIQLKNHGKLNDEAEEVGKLTFEEIAAQAFLFFLAGFETSSTAMTFALYELALNPEVQEKLRSEIKTILSKHDDELTYEAMLDMKYLQMVIDETLRKYPPFDNLLRTASNDYKVPETDLVIAKDTLIFIPVYAVHHDPDLYPEPFKFDPERFTDEMKRDRHPMAYMPFGEGPRGCLGSRFGLMQVKIALIMLLTKFKFSPSKKTTIPMKFSLKAALLSPIDDMWLQVERL